MALHRGTGSVPFYETSHGFSLFGYMEAFGGNETLVHNGFDTEGAEAWPWEFVDFPISTELAPPVPGPLSLSGIMVVILVNWSAPRTDRS